MAKVDSANSTENILHVSDFCLAGRVSTDEGPKDMSVRIPEIRVRTGGITAVIGGSGCGKSVLISLLMGYPSFGIGGSLKFGTFTMFGKDMPREAFRTFRTAAAWRRRMRDGGGLFYLPQAFPVAKTQRIRVETAMAQIVRAMAAPFRLSERDARTRIREAFERRNLGSALPKKLDSISGGERRRAELIARLVAMKVSRRPALLVLDEPTTGFDPDNALVFIRDVRRVIDELCNDGIKAAAFLSTHEMSCLDDTEGDRRIVDRVCVVHRDEEGPGKGNCTVLFNGPTDSVWQKFFPDGAKAKFTFSFDGDDLFRRLKTKTTDSWLSANAKNGGAFDAS